MHDTRIICYIITVKFNCFLMSKILLVSDSPYATTGLGRMSSYFLRMFPEHEWTIWGNKHNQFKTINNQTRPIWDDKDYKADFQIISPEAITGKENAFETLGKYLNDSGEKFDYILTSMDFDRAMTAHEAFKAAKVVNGTKWINYFPVDREDYKSMEVGALKFPDVNVVITKFGQKKIKEVNDKANIKQIYHPIDASEFKRLKHNKKIRREIFPKTDNDTFIIGNVSRTFARKDSGRLVKIATDYTKQNENTFTYIHGSRKTFEGLDLGRLAYESGMPDGKLGFLPKHINEVQGVKQEELNKIYNAFDLYLTVSSGEGFGFSTVEALLTETPIIAPQNTSFPELMGDFGKLIPTSEMAFHYNGHPSMWPIVNVEETIEAIKDVKENYSEYKQKAREGRDWVKENLSLENIKKQWAEILR